MEWRCISEEEAPSGIYWYTLRTGTPYWRKVGWSTGTDVEGLIVRKSTLESWAELLEKDSVNIWEHQPWPITDHHNITGHEVSLVNFSIVGRGTIVLPETSKVQYSSESMTHPSIETLASSRCHISGMRCWLDHQNYNWNNANSNQAWPYPLNPPINKGSIPPEPK